MPMTDSCRCMAQTNRLLQSTYSSIKNKSFFLKRSMSLLNEQMFED